MVVRLWRIYFIISFSKSKMKKEIDSSQAVLIIHWSLFNKKSAAPFVLGNKRFLAACDAAILVMIGPMSFGAVIGGFDDAIRHSHPQD